MMLLSLCPPVSLSVCHTFPIFKKSIEIANISLSNTTKLILLDSLLQEVTTGETQIATCLIGQILYFFINFSERLPWELFMYVLLLNCGCRRCLSEYSELVFSIILHMDIERYLYTVWQFVIVCTNKDDPNPCVFNICNCARSRAADKTPPHLQIFWF